jgi:hypothetical protein
VGCPVLLTHCYPQSVLGESGMQLEFHHVLDILLAHAVSSGTEPRVAGPSTTPHDPHMEEAMVSELLVLIGYYCLEVGVCCVCSFRAPWQHLLHQCRLCRALFPAE